MNLEAIVEKAASHATDRLDLWSRIVSDMNVASMAEIGVHKGDFASHILKSCPAINRYYMIDPWRHLDDWNKPANALNREFAEIKEQALHKTQFASDKRVVLQGKTTEVSNQLPKRGIDLAYIDGDHTLRGITIDLVQIARKIRPGGVLAGDDLVPSAWQHAATFEPTLVFPFVVYFAEATGSVIYALPFNQFAILVPISEKSAFEFRDVTGIYRSTALLDALRAPPARGLVKKAIGKLRRLLAPAR